MASPEKTIQILPDGKKIVSNSVMTLFQALMHKGIFLRSDCGGKGRCGKCLVLKKNGQGVFEEITACTYKVQEDVSIMIPETSLLSSHVMGKAFMSFPESFRKRMENRTQGASQYGRPLTWAPPLLLCIFAI